MRTPHLSQLLAATICLSLPAFSGADELDPAAAEALKAMSDKLGGAETFTFTGKRILSEDMAAATGTAAETEIAAAVKRPSHVHVAGKSDDATRDFYFDGKNVTLADSDAKVYASREFAGTIDEMLDKLEEALGFSPPIGDLLASNLYESLLGGEQTGKVAGEEKIGDTDCKHLAFSHPNVDWEIWIGSDDLPRKFCIKYKPEEVEGDFTFVVDNLSWDLDADVSAEKFSYNAPEGAEKIEILSPTEAAEAAKEDQ